MLFPALLLREARGFHGKTAPRTIGSGRVAAFCPGLTIAIMRKHTVKLHGRHCQISVHREGKHVWFAVGDYLDKEIRVQAESEGAAVKRWRETASKMAATEKPGHE
jgi:hypothetical protein